MDLRECIEALVNDEEFFVEIADLYYDIIDEQGPEFYDALNPSAVVPSRLPLGQWAIYRLDGGEYCYEFVEDDVEPGAVLTFEQLVPMLELYPYDNFATREALVDYIFSIAATN